MSDCADVPSMPIQVAEYSQSSPLLRLLVSGTAGTVQSALTPVKVPPVAIWPDQLDEMAKLVGPGDVWPVTPGAGRWPCTRCSLACTTVAAEPLAWDVAPAADAVVVDAVAADPVTSAPSAAAATTQRVTARLLDSLGPRVP